MRGYDRKEMLHLIIVAGTSNSRKERVTGTRMRSPAKARAADVVDAARVAKAAVENSLVMKRERRATLPGPGRTWTL